MSRRHIAAASVMLGTAAVAGVLAATRTTQLGQAAAPPTPADALRACLGARPGRGPGAPGRHETSSLAPAADEGARDPAAPEQVIVRRAQPTLVDAFHDDEHGEDDYGTSNEGGDD